MTTHEQESQFQEQDQENYIATNPDREEDKRRIINVEQTIKTGSIDDAIQEFSLAQPLWHVSHALPCCINMVSVHCTCSFLEAVFS